jgi:hypothetical protein
MLSVYRPPRTGSTPPAPSRRLNAWETQVVIYYLHAGSPFPVDDDPEDRPPAVSPHIRHLLGRFARCRSFEGRFSIFREFFRALEGPDRESFLCNAYHSRPGEAARRAFLLGDFLTRETLVTKP